MRNLGVDIWNIEDMAPLEPGKVYVLGNGNEFFPPTGSITFENGFVRFADISDLINHDRTFNFTAGHVSIDYPMQSAARYYERICIGVILSGWGHDGSRGAHEIKGQGGKVLVQVEDGTTSVPDIPDASYADEMPKCVLATTNADFVGPIRDMVSVLNQYLVNIPATTINQNIE